PGREHESELRCVSSTDDNLVSGPSGLDGDVASNESAGTDDQNPHGLTPLHQVFLPGRSVTPPAFNDACALSQEALAPWISARRSVAHWGLRCGGLIQGDECPEFCSKSERFENEGVYGIHIVIAQSQASAGLGHLGHKVGPVQNLNHSARQRRLV